MQALKLPLPKLTQLAFCGSTKPARLQHWIDQLRATQAAQTAALLYSALPELLNLKAEPAQRLELLEIMRPCVHQATLGLTKDFLHQPLSLPEQAQRTAIVAQALQKFLVDGYCLAIKDLLALGKLNPSQRNLLALSLHRAINTLGLIFCRSFQLYTQVPQSLWSQLHLLYRVAEHVDLLDTPQDDPLTGQGFSRIHEAYVRVLALGAGRLNQVAQQDVPRVFNQLFDWVNYIRLSDFDPSDKDCAFWVTLESDRPPLSRDRYQNRVDGPVLGLNFLPLLQMLARQDMPSQDNLASQKRARVPDDFPPALLSHLQQAWSGDTYRDLDRKGAGQGAKLAIGLFECHYQLAGEQPFDRFCQEETNRYDVGLPSFASLGKLSEKNDPRESLALGQCYEVILVNQSPGGYCVQ